MDYIYTTFNNNHVFVQYCSMKTIMSEFQQHIQLRNLKKKVNKMEMETELIKSNSYFSATAMQITYYPLIT